VNAPVSMKEFAAHARVSVGTVSNALNRPEIVARATRDRAPPGRSRTVTRAARPAGGAAARVVTDRARGAVRYTTRA
jgi:hypothetical protein